MLLFAAALKPYVDSVTKEYFTGATDQDQATTIATDAAVIVFLVLFWLVSAYGAARLSYYYNMNTSNSGSALFWSVLSFIFSDFYYPYYSYVLNPLSAKRRNNITIT